MGGTDKPEQDDYEQRVWDAIKADHWDDEKTVEELEKDIAYFMNHGMSRKEAEDYCNQQNGIVHYLKGNRGSVAFTEFKGLMISYGWK